MVLGFVWYGPLFGTYWIRLMGWSEAEVTEGRTQSMTKNYLLQALGSLVVAYVLAHVLIFASAYLNASGISAGVIAGFWNWLGFIAPVTLVSVLWEGKSWRLWVLSNGYYLISLIVMGVILAVWL